MALNGWTSKVTITVSSSLVTANLTGFPFILNAGNVPSELFGAVGGCKADGSDIRFASDSNGDTLLEFEVAHIDKGASELIVYVKADLSSTTDTVIYLFWGNASAQAVTNSVWSDYYAAVHFQEVTTGNGFKTAKDSSGTYNDISEAGTPTSVSGMVSGHKAWQMSATGDYAILEEEMNVSGDFYFEFFINFNGTAPTAGTQNIFCPVDFFSGVGSVGIGINAGALTVRDTLIGGAAFPDYNAWKHIAFYVDSGTMYYYVDGVLAASAAFTNQIQRLKWLSGAGAGLSVQFPASGYSICGLKFTRNTSIANAAEVIKTRWNNFNSLSSFATAGTVETVSIQTTLTLTNLKPNSEVRLYDATLTELAGVENSTDTFAYSYAYVSDVAAEVVIHSLGYEYIRFPLTLSNTSNTIPIQQQQDRNYINPI